MRTIFFAYQFSQVSPDWLQKCRRESLEAHKFFDSRQNPLFLELSLVESSYFALTWPIKVPLINDVFGYMNNFACFRCKKRQIGINYNIFKLHFCKRWTLFFVVFRTGPKQKKTFPWEERENSTRLYKPPRRSRGLHYDQEFSQPLKGVEDNVLVLRKRCFPKYVFFLLKLSAWAKKN